MSAEIRLNFVPIAPERVSWSFEPEPETNCYVWTATRHYDGRTTEGSGRARTSRSAKRAIRRFIRDARKHKP